MTVLRTRSLITALTVSLPLALGACSTEADPTEVDEIEDSIELDDGGYDMTDELPLFGDDALFDDAGELDVDTRVTDEMETDVDIVAMREAPDAALYAVRIVWGQLPRDPGSIADGEAPRNWSGALRVNRGAMVVRSTIRFEPATDRLLPRPDRRTVPFTSITGPASDGLLLQIVDPTPFADEPLVLAYATPEGEVYTVPVAALLDGPIVEDVDDLGNRVAAVAMRRPLDLCEYGFLGGRWHKVGPHFGRLIGRVTNADGDVVGHVRGVFGQRRSGEKVLFGKYINREGRFRGIFRGHYDAGHFLGRWHTRAGEHGRLGGHYRETTPGPETGGHFLGRWAETSCGLDTGPGTDVPGE